MGLKNGSIFYTDSQDPSSYSLSNQLAEHLEFNLVKDKITATQKDVYTALVLSVRDRMIRRWLRTQADYIQKNVKQVYYLSLEYLIGRLLGNALINLDFYDQSAEILKDIGYDIEDIIGIEHDMGLGNGGLGRLAACFMDSLATLQIPAAGYGIRYEYGAFMQDFEDGFQVERPDNWLRYGNPWEIMRPELTYRIKFNGRETIYTDHDGYKRYDWVDTEDVLATAYDIPIPGWRNNTVNNLRLWDARSTNEFSFEKFNEGQYLKAVEDKNLSENISKVLYPNDNLSLGKELRLKQQYFFVSATLQDIIRRFKINNKDFSLMPEKVAIHLNDTHPALAIPELMRILLDDEGLGWDYAWKITQNTFAYTNHTVLSEALERWSVPLFEKLLPRHLSIIYEINFRFLDKVKWHYNNNPDKQKSMSIIEDNGTKMIRMANLSIVGSHSVNGVAALHTDILKKRIFPDFYDYQPEKFNSKTNGITQRRWLRKANKPLAHLITSKIGEEWVRDLSQIKQIEKYIDDTGFREAFRDAKWKKKLDFAHCVEKYHGIQINPHSIFDAQIKRLHEYKRQLLNAMHLIAMYFRIKDNPNEDFVPRTVIFAGKAAPGYYRAKLIIKLINSIANVVNSDPDIGDKLKILFIPNYSVTIAEQIIPATELSEQISTAGYEASGTGNMKFQLNGALTIGTMDGANIEIFEEVGDENIFIFGKTEDEIYSLHQNGYNPWDYYNSNYELKRVIDTINSNYFTTFEKDLFKPVYDMLLHEGDRYCHLADYESYSETQHRAAQNYLDKEDWTKKAIINVANSGKFSSDRTIRQYADEIWKVKSHPIDKKQLE